MTRPVITYAELLAKIGMLETPRPGCVRVFRGQTKNYPTMLPSGLRTHPRNEAVWHSYAIALARDLLAARSNRSHPLDGRILITGDKEAVYINAVAQHYGPGSNFLDVTRSLDVALWFALHKALSITADYTLGLSASKNAPPELPLTESWTAYSKWDAGPGFLYEFEVSEFNGEGLPPHGSLLDLSKAQPIFSESKRIKAQAACLIAAEEAVDGGDLKCFLACEPIAVGWAMDGARQIYAPVEEMFPDPSKDEWYNRFVSIPLTHQAHPATTGLNLIRPIKVTLYRYQDEDKTKETLRRIKHVSPTRHDLSDTLTMDLIDEASAHRSEFHLTKATHILLDAPIMNWFPDAAAQIWNHGILAGDMSDNVEAFEFSTDEACGSVSLTNVYFEISPLEITNWAELHNSKADEIQVPGAIWIGRNGTHFAIKLFPRLVTSSKVLTMQFSSLYYEYCAANGTFWTNSRNKELWTPVTGDRQVDKAFFVVLTLLRFLSPVKKADPFPLEENLSSNGSRTMIIPVRGQVARLMRLLDSKRGLHWYVPRDILSKESFSLGRTAYCGTLSLELEVPWSSVDASEIRRDIAEHTGTSQGGSK